MVVCPMVHVTSGSKAHVHKGQGHSHVSHKKVKVQLDVEVKLAATVECCPLCGLLDHDDVIAGRHGDSRRTCRDDVTS